MSRTVKLISLLCLGFLTGCSGCGDETEAKHPDSCRVEGKQSGDKCEACCKIAGKSHHIWMPTNGGSCSCN